MDDVGVVHVLERVADLPDEGADLALGEVVGAAEVVVEVASAAELQH